MADKKARIAIQKLAEEINYKVSFDCGSLNKFAPFVNFKGGDCLKERKENKQEMIIENNVKLIENNIKLFKVLNKKIKALEDYLKVEMKENYYIKKTNG